MVPVRALVRQSSGHWQALLGEVRWSSVPDQDRTSFFAPDFALETTQPWLVGEQCRELTTDQLMEQLGHETFSLSQPVEPEWSSFQERHGEILRQIRSGELQKVVPVVFSASQLQGDFSAMVKCLVNVDAGLWPYGFSTGIEGMIGVSPEILFIKRGLRVETLAVAGTGPKNGSDLLKNKKEMLEHEFVIQDLRQELSEWGSVEVGKTEERVAGQLKHLVTPLSLKLHQETSFSVLVKILHPTAALGGLPRAASGKWLRAQPEAAIRCRFGAPFGWQEPNGNGTCLVAIRNLQWQNQRAIIGSGCGVVEGSVAEQEWQELKLKRQAILQVLGVHF